MSEFRPASYDAVIPMPSEAHYRLFEDDFSILIEHAGFEADIAARYQNVSKQR